jgi:biopolymer transport protein TolR
VPLVDVMLVLLVIFMVTAPMMQRGVEVKLPTSRRANPITANEPVYVTLPASYRADKRVLIGDEWVSADVLPERTRQTMLLKTDKHVFLRLERTVSAQEIIDVMDLLKDGGVQEVGIVSEFASPVRRR